MPGNRTPHLQIARIPPPPHPTTPHPPPPTTQQPPIAPSTHPTLHPHHTHTTTLEAGDDDFIKMKIFPFQRIPKFMHTNALLPSHYWITVMNLPTFFRCFSWPWALGHFNDCPSSREPSLKYISKPAVGKPQRSTIKRELSGWQKTFSVQGRILSEPWTHDSVVLYVALTLVVSVTVVVKGQMYSRAVQHFAK